MGMACAPVGGVFRRSSALTSGRTWSSIGCRARVTASGWWREVRTATTVITDAVTYVGMNLRVSLHERPHRSWGFGLVGDNHAEDVPV